MHGTFWVQHKLMHFFEVIVKGRAMAQVPCIKCTAHWLLQNAINMINDELKTIVQTYFECIHRVFKPNEKCTASSKMYTSAIDTKWFGFDFDSILIQNVSICRCFYEMNVMYLLCLCYLITLWEEYSKRSHVFHIMLLLINLFLWKSNDF